MNVLNINFEKLFREVEQNAWENKEGSIKYIKSNDNVFKIYGAVYEPIYEMFDTKHCIYLNNEFLYSSGTENNDNFKNDEEAIRYIQDFFKDKDVEILDILEDQEESKI